MYPIGTILITYFSEEEVHQQLVSGYWGEAHPDLARAVHRGAGERAAAPVLEAWRGAMLNTDHTTETPWLLELRAG